MERNYFRLLVRVKAVGALIATISEMMNEITSHFVFQFGTTANEVCDAKGAQFTTLSANSFVYNDMVMAA